MLIYITQMLKALRTLPRSSQTYLINIHTSYCDCRLSFTHPQLIIDACPHLYVFVFVNNNRVDDSRVIRDYFITNIMAEVAGLEPVISASKAGVLPLHYTSLCAACLNYQYIIFAPHHVFGAKHIAFSKHCYSL